MHKIDASGAAVMLVEQIDISTHEHPCPGCVYKNAQPCYTKRPSTCCPGTGAFSGKYGIWVVAVSKTPNVELTGAGTAPALDAKLEAKRPGKERQ